MHATPRCPKSFRMVSLNVATWNVKPRLCRPSTTCSSSLCSVRLLSLFLGPHSKLYSPIFCRHAFNNITFSLLISSSRFFKWEWAVAVGFKQSTDGYGPKNSSRSRNDYLGGTKSERFRRRTPVLWSFSIASESIAFWRNRSSMTYVLYVAPMAPFSCLSQIWTFLSSRNEPPPLLFFNHPFPAISAWFSNLWINLICLIYLHFCSAQCLFRVRPVLSKLVFIAFITDYILTFHWCASYLQYSYMSNHSHFIYLLFIS